MYDSNIPEFELILSKSRRQIIVNRKALEKKSEGGLHPQTYLKHDENFLPNNP